MILSFAGLFTAKVNSREALSRVLPVWAGLQADKRGCPVKNRESNEGKQYQTIAEPPTTVAPLALLASNLESFIKLAGAITAFLYFLGILSMNSYLLGLGVADFSPFNTRFILTGVVVLIPLALAAMIVFIVRDVAISINKGSKRWKSRNLVADALFAISVVFVIYALRSAMKIKLGTDDTVFLMIAIAVIIIMSDTIQRGIFYKYPKIGRVIRVPNRKEPLNTPKEVWPWLVMSIFWVIAVVVYVLTISSMLLEYVPQQFGGAKPQEVDLVVSGTAEADVTRMGVKGDDPFVIHAEVLWETGNYLLIRDQTGTVLRVRSELVSGWTIVSDPSQELDASPTAGVQIERSSPVPTQ